MGERSLPAASLCFAAQACRLGCTSRPADWTVRSARVPNTAREARALPALHTYLHGGDGFGSARHAVLSGRLAVGRPCVSPLARDFAAGCGLTICDTGEWNF